MCMLVQNERACLEVMLPKIPRPGPNQGFNRLIAVDGGSTDGTPHLLRGAGIETLTQTRPGRGAAYLEAVETYSADAYIFFSPDGNEDIDDLPKFRTHLERGADLVIASRMMPGAVNEEDENVFKWRKTANLIFNWMANTAFRKSGPYITDSINGYRAIRRSLMQRLELDATDYTIEYQMTIRALRLGATVVEFPTHEYPRIAGETGAQSIPTGLRFARRFLAECRGPALT